MASRTSLVTPTCVAVNIATIVTIALVVVSQSRAAEASTNDLYEELIVPYEVQTSNSFGRSTASLKTVGRSSSRLGRLRKQLEHNLTELIELRKRQRLSYVLSPLSEQIFPIRDETSKLSYNDLLALTDGYRAQLIGVAASQAKPASQAEGDDDDELGSCRTIRAPVELTKDDVNRLPDGAERLVRTCKGTVHVSRCEGACVSSVQPSVKSRTGFRKVTRALINSRTSTLCERLEARVLTKQR